MRPTRRRSTTARSICVTAAVGSALLAVALPATAGAAPRPALEILSPRPGNVHVSPSKPMHVRLRVAAGVRDLRVAVSGDHQRIVTKRLRGTSGGIRTATLRPGHELGHGAGSLHVSGRQHGKAVAASAHFYVADQRRKLLRVDGLPARTASAPLALRITAAKRADGVRVSVNGHRVEQRFSRTSSGLWRGTLAADDGLRFGRNRVVITAYDRDGAFDRVSRAVTIDRSRPLVGAGRDQTTNVRTPIRLDGRSTLPHNDSRLRTTWQIVSRPKGSKARIAAPHAIRPQLRPDVPGVYRVRLTATPRRAGTRATPLPTPPPAPSPVPVPNPGTTTTTPTPAPGTTTATTPTPPPDPAPDPTSDGATGSPSAPGTGSDVTTVYAQPAAAPRGLSVGTIGSESAPGLRVGTSWYPIGNGAVQLLVLGPAATPTGPSRTYAGNDAGMAQLAADLGAIDQNATVMLESPSSRPLQLSAGGTKTLQGIFTTLGVVPADPATGNWTSAGIPAGGWSVISTTGASPGAGRSLIGLPATPNGIVGEMDGYLESTVGGVQNAPGQTRTFTWPATFNTFDTVSAGTSATSNQMSIAGQTYSSGTIAAGASAFHLVWLDAGSLALRGQATIPGDQGTQLAQTLTGIESGAGPAVVLLTTIGHPAIPRNGDGATNGWASAAQAIAALGGNANAFLALDGSANAAYSLVGATGIGDDAPNAGLDVSVNLQPGQGAARLAGVLDRQPSGAWGVSTGGATNELGDVSALQPTIKQVLAQPDEPFAWYTSPGDRAAEAWIAQRVGLKLYPTYGIRANYWDVGHSATNWNTFSDKLAALKCPAPSTTDKPGPSDTAGDPSDTTSAAPSCPAAAAPSFAAVQAQLIDEFGDLAIVRGHFDAYNEGTLFAAVNEQFTGGEYTFQKIYDAILSYYTPPKAATARGSGPFDVLEGMVDAAAELAPGEGEVLGLVAAGIEIGTGLVDSFDGSSDDSYLGATVFEAQAGQFASILQTKYASSLNGLTRIADMLVSDAGRLSTASAKITEGDWEISNPGQVQAALHRGMAAYMWTSLLPTTFRAYQCVAPPIYYPPEPTDLRPAPWYPKSLKRGMPQYPLTTISRHPAKKPTGWGYASTDGEQIADGFLTIGRYHDGEHQFLTSADSKQLFGPLDPNQPEQLGLIPQYIAAPKANPNSPGFTLDPGSFNPRTTEPSPDYVSYTCAGNEWREDVNIRGQ